MRPKAYGAGLQQRLLAQCCRTNYTGHNYIGHNYIGHEYIGHNYIGHTYIGHTYIGGRFEYRHAHTPAMDMPSAMPR